MKKYSIVAFLEGREKSEVRQLQEKLFDLTKSRECLDAWSPHLTVGDGIQVSESQLGDVEKIISDLTQNQSTFKVKLKGFGGKTDRVGGDGEVTTPYVLWVKVDVNPELEKLVILLNCELTSKFNLWYEMPKPYTPHVTVAFRDLSEEGYLKGKDYLRDSEFFAEIEVSHIALVEKLSDTDKEYKRFEFKGQQ